MAPKKNPRKNAPNPQPIAPIEPVVPPQPVYPRPNISYNIDTGDFEQLTVGVKDLLLDPDTPFLKLGENEYLVIRLEVGEADEDGLLVLMRRSDLYLLGFLVPGYGIYLFDLCDNIDGCTRFSFSHHYPRLAVTNKYSVASVASNVMTFNSAIAKLWGLIRERQPVSDQWNPEILKHCVFLSEAGRNTIVYNNVADDGEPLPVSDWTRYLYNGWDKMSEAAFRVTETDIVEFDQLTEEEKNLVNGVLNDGDSLGDHFNRLLASPRACNAILPIKYGFSEVDLRKKHIIKIIEKAGKKARNGMRSDKIMEELKRHQPDYKKSTAHFGYMMRQLVSKGVLMLNDHGLYCVNNA